MAARLVHVALLWTLYGAVHSQGRVYIQKTHPTETGTVDCRAAKTQLLQASARFGELFTAKPYSASRAGAALPIPPSAAVLAGEWLRHASTHHVYPARLQRLVNKLEAHEAVTVAVLRTRPPQPAPERDYAAVLATWLDQHYPNSRHTVRVFSQPSGTVADLAQAITPAWVNSTAGKQVDLVVLDTFEQDHPHLEALLRHGEGPVVDYRDNNATELVQSYFNALEAVLWPVASAPGDPAVVALEGARSPLPREVASFLLHRYRVSTLSLQTARVGAEGVVGIPEEAAGWWANLTATPTNTHLLFGEMLLHLIERERAEIRCGFGEDTLKVENSELFVRPTPLESSNHNLTCGREREPKIAACADGDSVARFGGAAERSAATEWDAMENKLEGGLGTWELYGQWEVTPECEHALEEQYTQVARHLSEHTLRNTSVADLDQGSAQMQIRALLRRTRSTQGSGGMQRMIRRLSEGKSFRAAVFGNSFVLGHHCDESFKADKDEHNYVNQLYRAPDQPPYRHSHASGRFLHCAYMARFALWLEQSYPESKIDVVSFAAGGTCAGNAATYYAKDMNETFGDQPMDLYIVDYTQCSGRIRRKFHDNSGKLGFKAFNRFYMQDQLRQFEQLFISIRHRDPDAALLVVMDGWDGPRDYDDILPNILYGLLRRYQATPVMWISAMEAAFMALTGGKEPHRNVGLWPVVAGVVEGVWNGGHPVWRAHQMLAYTLQHAVLNENAHSICHLKQTEQAHHSTHRSSQRTIRIRVVNNAPNTSVVNKTIDPEHVTVAGNCPFNNTEGAYYRDECPQFCVDPCVGETAPLTEYDGMRPMKRGSILKDGFHFPAHSITPAGLWDFKPETKWQKWGWISSNTTEGEIVFAVRYREGDIHIQYLRTYNNIGEAEIRVDVVDTRVCDHTSDVQADGPGEMGAQDPHAAAGNQTVYALLNGYWVDKCSFPVLKVVRIAPHSGDGEYGCALVHVHNRRKEETQSAKFKVISIRSY